MRKILIDTGPIVAFYSGKDEWNEPMTNFLATFRGQFVTTLAVVSEVMWMLPPNAKVQNEFLSDLSRELYVIEDLVPADFTRIAELNAKYSDLHADFADLSLIAISERLRVSDILSLDSEFDVYRWGRNNPFKRLRLAK